MSDRVTKLLCGGACGLALLAAAPAGAQEPPPLTGPPGTSASKVLVIGTDGTRIDLVERLVREGRAPHLARLGAEGFAVPSLLAYQPPEAATISEVGWSSIATGVWPAKHGVRGIFINNDPGQATKNGYPDFLSRIEQVRPQLSTFLATNWANLGMHRNGGPIFGDTIDARHAIAAPDDIDGWDAADEEIARVSARYLREGDPDAGFVYLGIVDEVAHLAGSRTPRYLQAIEDTDRRIGDLLAALRARPSYASERWTVIVTTDHGQQDFDQPSLLSHGLGSNLERTSFVAAAGFGLRVPEPWRSVAVVDVAPTVLARLGIPIDPAWNLDGRPFATAPVAPEPAASARVRGRVLTVDVRAPQGSPAVGAVRLTLPAGLRVARVRSTPRAVLTRRGRTVTTATSSGVRRLRLTVVADQPMSRARVRVTIRDVDGGRRVHVVRPSRR